MTQEEFKKKYCDFCGTQRCTGDGEWLEECYNLKTLNMKSEDLNFLKNAIANKQCYNCALKAECEKEHPRTFEPIGTCNKWTDKNE